MNKAIILFCRLLRRLRLCRMAVKIEMWMFERLITASLLKAYGEFYDSIKKATDVAGMFAAAIENRHPEWCESWSTYYTDGRPGVDGSGKPGDAGRRS